jgi:hypothetical protein
VITDEQAKDALIVHLERVIRTNRDTLFVDLYKIALNGVLSSYGDERMRGMNPADWAEDAHLIATAAMERLK